ncbi:methylated-DNA--[protein]-cysteine S-methyltransferase [Thermanaerovibrio acidaminovorans]|uniref:methylated-DNA--[protein]-cysteine S-methyltransferase n=1 Tax=Thermanaerovibrio acidaminovorans TaxID=81462 RepID=UPI0024905B13|nr:methylated-DNA--[protein]-cysteine S-methyltransferase [Thermanaerovibrio acidaminovorans]
MSTDRMSKCHIETPLGTLEITESGGSITSVRLANPLPGEEALPPTGSVLGSAALQLKQYFAGERREFSLPLRLLGTPFQVRVWRRLISIPYGRTATYGELARDMGMPRGARAVGGACRRNPLLILIPCHRAVGARSLGGFSAPGGLKTKELLLQIERNRSGG